MTEPTNIGPPRDPELAEFALRFFLMQQPGWPKGEGIRDGCRPVVVWPTLKAYKYMQKYGETKGKL